MFSSVFLPLYKPQEVLTKGSGKAEPQFKIYLGAQSSKVEALHRHRHLQARWTRKRNTFETEKPVESRIQNCLLSELVTAAALKLLKSNKTSEIEEFLPNWN